MMEDKRSALEKLRALEAQAQQPNHVSDASGQAARNRKGIAMGALTGLVFLLLKFKTAIFFVFTKLKFFALALNLGKYLVTAVSMLGTLVVYAQFFGWRFAAGLLLLILIHEMGHSLAAASVGLPVSAPMFIPFFGAFITLKSRPQSTWQEHVVAAGGPAIGGIAAIGALYYGHASQQPLWVAVGYASVTLNLFNLIPIWQLDGARMVKVLTVKGAYGVFGLAGVMLLIITAVTESLNAVGLIICLIGFVAAFRKKPDVTQADTALEKLKRIEEAERATPDQIPEAQRWVGGFVYLLLFLVLVATAQFSQPALSGIAAPSGFAR